MAVKVFSMEIVVCGLTVETQLACQSRGYSNGAACVLSVVLFPAIDLHYKAIKKRTVGVPVRLPLASKCSRRVAGFNTACD
ncbi:hypothetical protein [Burkholderia ambifaria]|uniref:hypothetical protein n=1 Tax=Burkholderia ambifaria TaxID=152480 RepID=UPI00158E080D|nr:hypothetical protein [Burkholderia ambifaria]